MLTQSDRSFIKQAFKEELQRELKPIKRDIEIMKEDIRGLKHNVTLLIKIVGELQERVESMEDRLSFTYKAAVHLLSESQKIQDMVVDSNVVKRVEQLERLTKSS